jgi:hypothetical protein
MAANHKLTAVLKGRSVTGVDQESTTARVRFDDGSVMTVQLASGDAPQTPQAPGRIRGARQTGTTLQLDDENGGTLELHTAEPTASVIVRAADGSLEYAD